jgi:hypothetical protein
VVFVDHTDDLDPKVPTAPVVTVDARIQLVEGDIHGVSVVLIDQSARLPGNLGLSIPHCLFLLSRAPRAN